MVKRLAAVMLQPCLLALGHQPQQQPATLCSLVFSPPSPLRPPPPDLHPPGPRRPLRRARLAGAAARPPQVPRRRGRGARRRARRAVVPLRRGLHGAKVSGRVDARWCALRLPLKPMLQLHQCVCKLACCVLMPGACPPPPPGTWTRGATQLSRASFMRACWACSARRACACDAPVHLPAQLPAPRTPARSRQLSCWRRRRAGSAAARPASWHRRRSDFDASLARAAAPLLLPPLRARPAAGPLAGGPAPAPGFVLVIL